MSRADISDENPYASPAEGGLRCDQSPDSRKFIFATMKFAGMTILIAFLLDVFNIVSFTYRRTVDNDPLRNSVRVVRIHPMTEELELADGRLVTDFWEVERLAEAMKRYQTNEVEIVPSPDVNSPDRVDIYASDFNFICEIGRNPLVSIPLIPINQRRFKRMRFGSGKCEETDTGHERLTSSP